MPDYTKFEAFSENDKVRLSGKLTEHLDERDCTVELHIQADSRQMACPEWKIVSIHTTGDVIALTLRTVEVR